MYKLKDPVKCLEPFIILYNIYIPYHTRVYIYIYTIPYKSKDPVKPSTSILKHRVFCMTKSS